MYRFAFGFFCTILYMCSFSRSLSMVVNVLFPLLPGLYCVSALHLMDPFVPCTGIWWLLGFFNSYKRDALMKHLSGSGDMEELQRSGLRICQRCGYCPQAASCSQQGLDGFHLRVELQGEHKTGRQTVGQEGQGSVL